jgi:6-phosphogluconolactonase
MRIEEPCISVAEVRTRLAELIARASASAVADHGSFHVAFSGGSLPGMVGAGLAEWAARGAHPAVDYSRWVVYFADERHVPGDHADSNVRLFREDVAGAVPGAAAAEVVAMPYDAAAPDVGRAAAAYEALVVARLAGRPLDLVLLGMGPDGHMASLFPGHALLDERTRVVAPIRDSPKPPPERVTFTLPVLRAASAVVFAVTGSGKRAAAENALGPNPSVPSGLLSDLPSVRWLYCFEDGPS